MSTLNLFNIMNRIIPILTLIVLLFWANVAHANTFEFIAKHEGFRSCSYPDGGGWSVGYGSLGRQGYCISEPKARSILNAEIERLRIKIEERYPNLSEEQQTALISFAFNTPVTQPLFHRSDLNDAIQNRDKNKMTEIFLQYAPFRGNVIRRNEEIELFFSSYESVVIDIDLEFGTHLIESDICDTSDCFRPFTPEKMKFEDLKKMTTYFIRQIRVYAREIVAMR